MWLQALGRYFRATLYKHIVKHSTDELVTAVTLLLYWMTQGLLQVINIPAEITKWNLICQT